MSKMLLQSGNIYDFNNVKENVITIEDIALSLSNICRYGGSVDKHYSVAQHSVYVSLCVDEQYAMEGLMHDAAEAYLGDIPTPLKMMLSDYKLIEAVHEREIFSRFGLIYPMPQAVHIADRQVLLAEIRDIKPKNPYWDCLFTHEPFDMKIIPWSPELAREMFLKRYRDILTKRTIN